MIEWIGGILTVIAFLIAVFSAIIAWGQDADLEKYYHDTVVKTITKSGYLPKSLVEVPKKVIIDSGQKTSPIRTYLKRKLAWLRHEEIPPVILVFGHNSEEERKAFLIEKGFASSVESRLLDLDFIESLIHYLAYKCVHESGDIEEKVGVIIRKYFETSKYRDCLIKLDSLDFSKDVVLNPPPLKKPLLTNVVLPMIREKERSLLSTGSMISEIEGWKSFAMNIINCLCSGECAVLFIGVRDDLDYWDILGDGIKRFSHVILSARGPYIHRMLRVIKACHGFDQTNPEEERILTGCESKEIIGYWEYPNEERIPCQWVIFSKS